MKLFDTVRMKAALLVLKEDVRLRDERIKQLEAEVQHLKKIATEALRNADDAIKAAAQANGGRK